MSAAESPSFEVDIPRIIPGQAVRPPEPTQERVLEGLAKVIDILTFKNNKKPDPEQEPPHDNPDDLGATALAESVTADDSTLPLNIEAQVDALMPLAVVSGPVEAIHRRALAKHDFLSKTRDELTVVINTLENEQSRLLVLASAYPEPPEITPPETGADSATTLINLYAELQLPAYALEAPTDAPAYDRVSTQPMATHAEFNELVNRRELVVQDPSERLVRVKAALSAAGAVAKDLVSELTIAKDELNTAQRDAGLEDYDEGLWRSTDDVQAGRISVKNLAVADRLVLVTTTAKQRKNQNREPERRSAPETTVALDEVPEDEQISLTEIQEVKEVMTTATESLITETPERADHTIIRRWGKPFFTRLIHSASNRIGSKKYNKKAGAPKMSFGSSRKRWLHTTSEEAKSMTKDAIDAVRKIVNSGIF
jgi:hypothetical protein